MQTLKTITEALRITKKDIAKHCKVSNQSADYWINGKFTPKPKNKAKIMELSKGIIREEHFTNTWNEYHNKDKQV